MRAASYSILLLLFTFPAMAGDRFPAGDCAEMKQGIETFLRFADQSLTRAGKMEAKGDKEGGDEAYEEAYFLSELAENYSTVYQVFCKTP